MQIQKESENEFRIRLTKDDLAPYGLTAEGLDWDSAVGKAFFHELFRRVEQETDCPISGRRLYIQSYEKKNGECELFLIPLSEKNDLTCYLFREFGAFCTARRFLEHPENAECYRISGEEAFLIQLPKSQVPAVFPEWGEEWPWGLDDVYRNCRCRSIEERMLP